MLSPRASTRKAGELKCKCCVVNETKTKEGSKVVKKLVLTDKKFNGTMNNISAGGCAVSAGQNIKAGTNIKMDITIKDHNAAALGTALRVNKSSEGTVMHIRFIKVPPKSLAHINAYIFGYE